MVDEHGVLLLAAGWLRDKGLGDGDVIAIGPTGDGLAVNAASQPLAGPEAVAGMGRALSAVLDGRSNTPELLDTAVWTACADDPALFTAALLPLSEAMDACGLVRRVTGPGLVAGAGRPGPLRQRSR